MYNVLFEICYFMIQSSDLYTGVAFYINDAGESVQHIITNGNHFIEHLDQLQETESDPAIKQVVEVFNNKTQSLIGKDAYGNHYVKDENSHWIVKKSIKSVMNSNGVLQPRITNNPNAAHLGDDSLLKKIVCDENFVGFR